VSVLKAVPAPAGLVVARIAGGRAVGADGEDLVVQLHVDVGLVDAGELEGQLVASLGLGDVGTRRRLTPAFSA